MVQTFLNDNYPWCDLLKTVSVQKLLTMNSYMNNYQNQSKKKLTLPEFIKWLGVMFLIGCYQGILDSRERWSMELISSEKGAPFCFHQHVFKKILWYPTNYQLHQEGWATTPWQVPWHLSNVRWFQLSLWRWIISILVVMLEYINDWVVTDILFWMNVCFSQE